MSEEMKAWVAWNPGAKINVRLVHGWEEEMWAYQLNLSGEHHPTTIVAMELPLASRTPSANREVVDAVARAICAEATIERRPGDVFGDLSAIPWRSEADRCKWIRVAQAALAAMPATSPAAGLARDRT